MNTKELTAVLKNIGGNAYRLRRKRGFTQEGLADAASLDLRFIQRIERGTMNVSIATLMSLSNALGAPPAEFFRPATVNPARAGRPSRASRTRASKVANVTEVETSE